MGQFAVMSLTNAAAERIKSILAASDRPAHGIRVGIKKGGCAGMEYTVDLAQDARQNEDVVEREGAKVFISPEAVLFLLGTEMDYEETVLRSGFVFKNPNQTSACGCGESVELKQADLAAMAAAQQA